MTSPVRRSARRLLRTSSTITPPVIFRSRFCSAVRSTTTKPRRFAAASGGLRSEEHTSELQSHSDLHSFPTRRSSDLLFDYHPTGDLQVTLLLRGEIDHHEAQAVRRRLRRLALALAPAHHPAPPPPPPRARP